MDHRRHPAVVLAAIVGCAPPPAAPIAQRTELLAPLPEPAAVSTTAFTSVVVCERCHPNQVGEDNMLAQAARDPYFLAAVRRELQHRPSHATEETCLACHAPVGHAEDPRLTLDDVERGTSDAAKLARDGVGCLGCHARDGAGLRRDRTVDGLQPQPLDEAMRVMAKTSVVTHAVDCLTCHAVRIGNFLEQATALEWQASSRDKTCVECHLPRGEPQAYATRPPNAPVRDYYVSHAIRGGRTEGAARLDVARVAGGAVVTVENLTGHKLPTGFPTRRMWLHAVALDGDGSIVFESGSHRRGAVLVGGRGIRLDLPGVVLPHRTRIERVDQLAIWEAVPIDARGKPTHVLFDAVGFAKDDRIPPAGFVATAETAPIGVGDDPDFRAGSDAVTYVLPATTQRFEVELLYENIPPETVESYAPGDSPEAASFLATVQVKPIVLASALLQLQPAP